MTVERELWKEKFSRHAVPHFLCPWCRKGRMTMVKGSLIVKEPAFSAKAHSSPHWEPDWVKERFAFSMTCGIPTCGEIALVCGETQVEQVEDEDEGWIWESMLCPRAI